MMGNDGWARRADATASPRSVRGVRHCEARLPVRTTPGSTATVRGSGAAGSSAISTKAGHRSARQPPSSPGAAW